MEDLHALHGFLVLDQDHEIGREHVVNQRDHLVADAFDAMLPAAAICQRRAFIWLQCGDFRFGKRSFDLIAGRDGSSRARRRRKSSDASVAHTLDCIDGAAAGHMAMKTVIREELELRQRLVLWILHQLACFFERQNHVRLRTGRQLQLAAILLNARVTLLAHVVGHDHDGAESEQLGNICGTNAEIAG